jgi:ribosomal protein S18 acetylase RimI-like enzyme
VALGEVAIEAIDRADPRVRELYARMVREADAPLGIDLEAEFAGGPPPDLVPPHGILLVARVDGEAVGIGGVRHLDTEAAEVKSMFVSNSMRRRGVGRKLLAELERIAAERGCRAVRLDTSDYLTPALGLYRSAGYAEIPAYNENPKANVWFERQL